MQLASIYIISLVSFLFGVRLQIVPLRVHEGKLFEAVIGNV